jgi:predicted  nucleic acid-binding Zn-ribbon protein
MRLDPCCSFTPSGHARRRQAGLERARRELEEARGRASPVERERAAAEEEARRLRERKDSGEQALAEMKQQVRPKRVGLKGRRAKDGAEA